MAREVFFHQCLWVTKLCAKFGRSRIPTTARAPNSFIILRCMWKEPAPLFSMAIPTFRTKQGNKLQSTRTVVEYCSLFGNENVVTPYKKSVSCCTTIAGVCTNWWFLFSKQCNAWPQQRKQSVILSTDQCVNGVDGDYAVEASTCDKVYASVSKMSHPYQLTANMEEIASYIIQK